MDLLSAGVIGGTSLLGNILSNTTAKDMARQEYKYNLRLWNMQNEYNKPVNQINRLKEAGLNPALAYGHGSVAGNTASTPSSYHAPSQHYDFGQAVNNALNYGQIIQNYRNAAITNDNLKQEGKRLSQETRIAKAKADRLIAENNLDGVNSPVFTRPPKSSVVNDAMSIGSLLYRGGQKFFNFIKGK